MSLFSKLSACLDAFEAGRAFKARVRVAKCQASEHRQMHPLLAHLRYIIVEPSFFCNLKCQMCPRLFEARQEGFMPLARFERIASVFPYLEAVVFAGWGEPLMNPQLPDFARMVRLGGSRPRMLTNAMLLNEEKALALIDAGIDHLQVSLDGGTPETYEAIRAGAKWSRVLENATRFNRLVRESGVQLDTGCVMVLMRHNFHELPLTVRAAADCGFPLFTAKLIERNSLDYEHDHVLHDEAGRLLVDPEAYQKTIDEARRVAEERGIELRIYDYHMGTDGGCVSEAQSSVFVDWRGNVVPCCHLPIVGDMDKTPPHLFGNIDEQDLMEIVLGDRAQRFWQNWRSMVIPRVCSSCYQLSRLPNRDAFTHECRLNQELSAEA